MTQEEFDALMPHEFWREVVDRVAVEVPGTLLLAEAFWMLEGYFVRTLGMHRVYNSAFMNMLRDEENAKYRSYLKKTIEFDPDILKRYVNFMSNPDERTTIDQFGSDDKCFGVATLMSTLPGLPMFGHGQIEGYTERYGMEYKRARMDEWPNDALVARHQQEIAPLLKRRHVFAESANFVMYDFWTDHGTVDENVFAYSNRAGNDRGLILYNNTYGSTRGTIHTSVASMDKHTGELRQRQLSEAMNLRSADATMIGYRDATRGLSFLRRSRDFDYHGLTVDLRGYQYVVLQDFRELQATAEYPWDQLCDALQGGGVHNLDEALSKLRLRPLHEALRQALNRKSIETLMQVAQEQATRTPGAAASVKPMKATPAKAQGGEARSQEFDERLEVVLDGADLFFEQIQRFAGVEHGEGGSSQASSSSSAATLRYLLQAASQLPALEQTFSSVWPSSVRTMLPSSAAGGTVAMWAPVLAWTILHASAMLVGPELFDHFQLRSALAETFSALELHGDDAWRFAARVRLLLMPGSDRPGAWLGSAAFWREGDVQWLAGINRSDGTTYFNKEQFEETLSWIQLPSLMLVDEAKAPMSLGEIEQVVSHGGLVAAEASYDVDRFIALWNVAPRSPSGGGPPLLSAAKTSSPEEVSAGLSDRRRQSEARTAGENGTSGTGKKASVNGAAKSAVSQETVAQSARGTSAKKSGARPARGERGKGKTS